MASSFPYSFPLSLPCSVLYPPDQELQPNSLVYFPCIAVKYLIDCTKVGFEMDISEALMLVVTTPKYNACALYLSPKCNWKKQIYIE